MFSDSNNRWQTYLSQVTEFVRNEVWDQATELDASHTFPAQIVGGLAQLGVFGLPIPAPFGGLEAPISVQIEVSRIIAQGWLSLSSIVGTHWRVVGYILSYGSDLQKEEFLPAMALGKMIAANGHTEKHGKDWRFLETELSPQKGGYTISGTKSYITNAAHADLIAVTAKCSSTESELSPDGFVIALLPRNHPGLVVGTDIARLGIKGVHICSVTLENCPLDSARHLLGRNVGARKISDSSLIPKLLDVSARAVGVGERLVEKSRACLQRDRGPRKALKDFPLAKHRLASFSGKIRMAGLALAQLGVLADQGKLDSADAHFLQVFSTQAALEAATETLLIHGGAGYTTDTFVQRCLRDVVSLQIVGTPRDQVLAAYSDMLLA